MSLNPPIARTTKGFLLKAAILPILLVVIFAQSAIAGDGTFTSTGGVNGTFDFCVVIQFNATPLSDRVHAPRFSKRQRRAADATEGHHRFGKVNFVNNCGNGCAAAASADWFVINTPGTAYNPKRFRLTLYLFPQKNRIYSLRVICPQLTL